MSAQPVHGNALKKNVGPTRWLRLRGASVDADVRETDADDVLELLLGYQHGGQNY